MNRLFIIAALAALACGRPQHSHESHGQAFSSQSIVLHQNHGTEQRAHRRTQPVVLLSHGHEEQHQEYYAHPKYEFEYKVEDPHTGDNKFQHEVRDGDAVQGVYSLHEADGTVRIVEYTADKHSGFNAIVRREGHAQHAVPVHPEYHH